MEILEESVIDEPVWSHFIIQMLFITLRILICLHEKLPTSLCCRLQSLYGNKVLSFRETFTYPDFISYIN